MPAVVQEADPCALDVHVLLSALVALKPPPLAEYTVEASPRLNTRTCPAVSDTARSMAGYSACWPR